MSFVAAEMLVQTTVPLSSPIAESNWRKYTVAMMLLTVYVDTVNGNPTAGEQTAETKSSARISLFIISIDASTIHNAAKTFNLTFDNANDNTSDRNRHRMRIR